MTGTSGDENWRRWVPSPDGRPFVLCRAFPPFPGLWDLAVERDVVPHWTGLLRGNARYLLEVLEAEGGEEEQRRAARALRIFDRLLDDLDAGRAGEIRTVHEVTLVRETLLRRHGIPDPYQVVKAREANRWLPAAGPAIERAWQAGAGSPEPGAAARILGWMLAGNLFDLGSHATREAYRAGGHDDAAARRRFTQAARRSLARMEPARAEFLRGAARPLAGPPAGRMLLFADNAGADFLLGVLPAAVYFARRWEVALVVNSLPASNDICYPEARAHLALLADMPGSPLAELQACGRLRLVESGTGSPGIDLHRVGPALNRAAREADWILIEGQGRAAETNWATRFRCPALRVAVLKDPLVASALRRAPGSALLAWDDAD